MWDPWQHLRLSTTKTMSAVFHLNNMEAKRELKVNFNNETLRLSSNPKYLGVAVLRGTHAPQTFGWPRVCFLLVLRLISRSSWFD